MTKGKTCKDCVHFKKSNSDDEKNKSRGMCKASRKKDDILYGGSGGLNVNDDFACDKIKTK